MLQNIYLDEVLLKKGFLKNKPLEANEPSKILVVKFEEKEFWVTDVFINSGGFNCGKIVKIFVYQRQRNYALVQFEDIEAAQLYKNQFQDKFKVQFSQKRELVIFKPNNKINFDRDHEICQSLANQFQES